MATMNKDAKKRNSYILAVTPVDYSLTAGTDIPAPPDSPRPSIKEPPTPGGGPLSSHPATPERKIPGAYPESEPDEDDVAEKNRMEQTSPEPQANGSLFRRQSGVRKLMSLSNLRSSFSSSRTSLALPRASFSRPSTSRNNERPFTPSNASTTSPSNSPGKSFKQRRSGSWFKRKSSLFMMNHDGTLDAVAEDARENKRLKMPMLPEISELGGGDFDGGNLDWDSSAFQRV